LNIAARLTSATSDTTTQADGKRAAARRPWWIWVVPSLALFGVVVAQNTFLFSTKLYERGDGAADSILVQQALRLRLLVGHYSREGFNHPGPAYLYGKAFGQWLGYDVLHIVPTPWNGQFLALFALNSAFAGLAAGVVYGWTSGAGRGRGLAAAAMAFAVVCLLCAQHTLALVSGWMPNVFVLTYLVFMLSAASVAARNSRDLWVLALSGWMLIHGYAPFFLFVPLIVVTAAAIALWPDRRHLVPSVRAFLRGHRGTWMAVAVISAVFLLPITVNLALHWPGQFGNYITYSKSKHAGGHTLRQVAGFMGWYWWPGSATWAIPLLLPMAAAPVVVLTLPRGQVRRCLAALLVIAGVTTLAFAFYAFTAADFLTNYYIGYFYWSVPYALLLITVVGVVHAIRARAAIAFALASSVTALWGLATQFVLHADVHDNDPTLPGAVASLAERSHDKAMVLDVQGQVSWVEALGFLVQAERTGVRACVHEPAKAYLVTSELICTRAEVNAGARYRILDSAPHGARVVLQFGTANPGYVTVVAG
jgi:hypothetical protein